MTDTATSTSPGRAAVATLEDAKRDVAMVTRFLRDGYPAMSPPGNSRSRSAVRMAAQELAIPRATLCKRIGTPGEAGTHWHRFGLQPDWTAGDKARAERGELGFEPVMPGYVVKSTATARDADGNIEREWIQTKREPGPVFALPPGQVIKGVSAYLDSEGREIGKWVKTGEGRDPVDIVETIKAAFADYAGPATPISAPVAHAADYLTILPCADWHVGMFAWGAETGGTNWDLRIAEETIGTAVEEVIARSPCSAEAVVLGGGDLLHADNSDNRTARSGNALQVDGRYQKVLMAASRLMVRTVDASLRRHGRVTVRILPGNHDEHAAVAVAYFLLAWYRDEPRVTVDTDPSLFWWHRFGRVMLGATHGHTTKITAMPGIMAARRAEDWGNTRHRYVHGFHLHHTAKFATEDHGVISEIHQSPVPQDAWHYGAGFLSGRSIQTITYHREYGEVSRARVAILDATPAVEDRLAA